MLGKQPYGEYTPQEQIHEMIKHFAFMKGKVVRLKGGDPFIFGRGFEEIIYARAQGIKTHFIPGITTMQASGFQDIPLTHRLVSESIWLITGTKKDGRLSEDLKMAMQSNATVVIYMGMKNLMRLHRLILHLLRAIPRQLLYSMLRCRTKNVRGVQWPTC